MCIKTANGNIGEIQPYMFEPQSDPDSDEEPVVHQNRRRCYNVFTLSLIIYQRYNQRVRLRVSVANANSRSHCTDMSRSDALTACAGGLGCLCLHLHIQQRLAFVLVMYLISSLPGKHLNFKFHRSAPSVEETLHRYTDTSQYSQGQTY